MNIPQSINGDGMNLSSPIVQSILNGNGGRFDLPSSSINVQGNEYTNYINNYYSTRVEKVMEPIPMYNNMMYNGYPMYGGYHQTPQTMYVNGQPQMMGYQKPFEMMMNPPQQQMQYGGYQQPSYYGNYVPGMIYNPYAIRAQQEAMKAARAEQCRQQSEVFKTLSKCCHANLGDKDEFEDFEQHLRDRWDYVPEEDLEKKLKENPEYEEIEKYVRLCAIGEKSVRPTPEYNYAFANFFNKKVEERQKEFPDNMSLAEFLDKAHILYIDALRRNYLRGMADGKKQYDSSKYRNLIRQSNGGLSSYFNSILRGRTPNPTSVNVGDMTIDLPTRPGDKSKINVNCPFSEYDEALDKFFQAIDKDNSTAAYLTSNGGGT